MQRLLNENMVTGISKVKVTSIPSSDDCQFGKLTRPSHPSRPFEQNTTCALQLVVMDLAGPVRPKIISGAAYILNLFEIFTIFS